MGTPLDSSQICRDFRLLALSQIDQASSRCSTEVEVPDSAVGHIIGKSHRTINALRLIPGITHVSVHEDLEDEEKQRVQVEGSADGVERVLAQIKRLQMRSYAASVQPEMQFACFRLGPTLDSQCDDPLILRVASADKLLLYMPQHLRTFLYRNFPEDYDERIYYYFHSRSSGEAAATSFIVAPPLMSKDLSIKPNNRTKFLEKSRCCQLFGSWERTFYHHHLVSTLSSVLEQCAATGMQVKMRLVFGKSFFFGTDLTTGVLWKVSLEKLDKTVLEQRLRPLFSVYSSFDSVRRARRFIQASGYERVDVTKMVSVQLVDMDTEPEMKESYHLKLNEQWKGVGELAQEEPVVRFHKVAKKHTFLTFLNDHKGVDLELRIQTRKSEGPLDPETCRSLFEAWHKMSNAEDPLTSSSGKRYYPLNVLHKDAETYRKDGFEVSLTEVTSAGEDQDKSSSRWKVCIRSLQLQEVLDRTPAFDLEIANQVDDILGQVDHLVDEALKLADSMAG